MIGKNFRIFKTADGRDCKFNHEEFKRWYKRAPRGEKGKLKEQLADMTSKSIDAVEGWVKGSSGPSDLEFVRILENFFNVRADSFLTFLENPTEKTELEENMMREIKDYERDAARKLYVEMCSMIEGLEYYPDHFIRAAGISCTPQGFRYLGKEPFPFMYRDNLIQNVRKTGFDLPKQTRDQLIQFIIDAFGDGCYDMGMMYFESDEYKEYLEKNGFEDNDDIKEFYSVSYINGLYEKLDDIFTDYLRE